MTIRVNNLIVALNNLDNECIGHMQKYAYIDRQNINLPFSVQLKERAVDNAISYLMIDVFIKEKLIMHEKSIKEIARMEAEASLRFWRNQLVEDSLLECVTGTVALLALSISRGGKAIKIAMIITTIVFVIVRLVINVRRIFNYNALISNHVSKIPEISDFIYNDLMLKLCYMSLKSVPAKKKLNDLMVQLKIDRSHLSV